jgi:hypothetical protein
MVIPWLPSAQQYWLGADDPQLRAQAADAVPE